MPRNFRDKVALSGITVLSIGIVLLMVTFASTFGFLSDALPILASENLAQTFGETLAPLIATSIRVMYLGVMGWIGSLVTIRGVTLIANAPKTEASEQQKQLETKPKKSQTQLKPAEKNKKQEQPPQQLPKSDEKTGEPEIAVIPPEEMEQQLQQMPS
jgi:hypothetical protein